MPILMFIWLGLFSLLGCHPSQPTKHDEKGTYPVTSPVRRDTEITREYVSQVRAIQHIELRAQERGYLQGIFVDEGQEVKAGRRMFQIMPVLYQAEMKKAEAEAEFTQIEYQNTKILADGTVVSPQELALAKAKMNKAQAELALAKVHLDFTDIRAPFSGIMGRFHGRLGSLVDEGELLTTLSDNRTVWVYFNVTEAEYLDYKSHAQGAEPKHVRLMMANGALFPQVGTIQTIEADFNNETGNIAFRAGFANPNGLLRHGETGKILMTTTLANALVIPQKATFEVLDKKYVFVVDDAGVVQTREISVTHEIPHLFVVSSGLTEKDHVLLDGLRKVRDGSQIVAAYQEPSTVFASLEPPVP